MNIYTGGTFDLPHAGHVIFLETAKSMAGPSGTLTVGLNTDEFVERFKKSRPTIPLEERITMLRALRCVDRVVINEGDELSSVAIEKLGDISALAIGSDWHKNGDAYLKQLGVDWAWMGRQNISLIYIPRHYPQSSTLIKREIRNADRIK